MDVGRKGIIGNCIKGKKWSLCEVVKGLCRCMYSWPLDKGTVVRGIRIN